MKNPQNSHKPSGFSLVELLVVIAVIGTIASIAIPAISGVYEKSTAAKSRRNAQSISALYASLRAAGATVASPSEATIAAAISDEATNGISGLAGTVFAGSKFYVPMNVAERDMAAAKLLYVAASDSLTVLP